MTTFDLSPLFRTAIGFDRLASALETANRADAGGLAALRRRYGRAGHAASDEKAGVTIPT